MKQKTKKAERLSATRTGKLHMHEWNKAEQASKVALPEDVD